MTNLAILNFQTQTFLHFICLQNQQNYLLPTYEQQNTLPTLAELSSDPEFQLKLQKCLQITTNTVDELVDNHGFLSDLLLLVIKSLKTLHSAAVGMSSLTVGSSSPGSKTTAKMLYLSLFNILATTFQSFIGPAFSTHATIVNLLSAAGEKLNNRTVEIMAFDAKSGRFCVKVEKGDVDKKQWKRIKPENLVMLKSDSKDTALTRQLEGGAGAADDLHKDGFASTSKNSR